MFYDELVYVWPRDDKFILCKPSSNNMFMLAWNGEKFYNTTVTDSTPQCFQTQQEAIDFGVSKGWFVQHRTISLRLDGEQDKSYFDLIFINNEKWVNFKQMAPICFDKVVFSKFITQLEKIRDQMEEC
jgi:hypothetical protein